MIKYDYEKVVAPELKAVVQLLEETFSGEIGMTYDKVYESVQRISEKYNVSMGYLVQFIDIAGGVDMVLKREDLTQHKRSYSQSEDQLIVRVKELVSGKMAQMQALKIIGEKIHRTGGALDFRSSQLKKEGLIEQYQFQPIEEAEKDAKLMYEREKKIELRPEKQLAMDITEESVRELSVTTNQEQEKAHSEVAVALAPVVPIRKQEVKNEDEDGDLIDDLAVIFHEIEEGGEDVATFFKGFRKIFDFAKKGKEQAMQHIELQSILEEKDLQNQKLLEQVELMKAEMKKYKEESDKHHEKVLSLEAEVYQYEKLTPVQKIIEMKNHNKRVQCIIHPGGLVDVKK